MYNIRVTPSEDILELFINLILTVLMSSVFSSHASCFQSSAFMFHFFSLQFSSYMSSVFSSVLMFHVFSLQFSFLHILCGCLCLSLSMFLWTSCFIFDLIFLLLSSSRFKEIHVHDEESHHRPPRPPRRQKKPASTGPRKTPSPPVSKLTKNISSSSSNKST